jgi:hypothetical protein
MIRTHLTWSGKARDLPRFSLVYADTAAALGLRLTHEGPRESNPSRISAGGRLPQSRPAADWGRRA